MRGTPQIAYDVEIAFSLEGMDPGPASSPATHSLLWEIESWSALSRTLCCRSGQAFGSSNAAASFEERLVF